MALPYHPRPTDGPALPFSHATPSLRYWLSQIAAVLDARSAPRCLSLLFGVLVATGRRTVTAWLRAAGIAPQFRPAYTTVAAVGRHTDSLADGLLHRVLKPLLSGVDRILLGIDDTPTQRSGPHVPGAGLHHNPTPGPAGAAFVYGHSGVVLGWLGRHPTWGTVALPLLARLYVRAKTLPRVPEAIRPVFRTKLELAVQLVDWALAALKGWSKPRWVVVDGAFAKAPFLKPVCRAGVTIVSRLRKDAALHSLPGPSRPGQRGRRRIYGEQRIALAKRAGQRRGWQTGIFALYGKATRKRYQTFRATWRPAGGEIRVVLVREPDRWVAFFCTQPEATVADVLESVAARFSLETAFRDRKQVVGAGQQQVRKLATNVDAFHLCLWGDTLTEAWAWGQEAERLVDRSGSPWDDATRRPSHADKRRAWRREWLGAEIQATLAAAHRETDWRACAERLLDLAC